MKKDNGKKVDPVKLMELWGKKSVPEIAQQFGCSTSTIYQKAKLLGLQQDKMEIDIEQFLDLWRKDLQVRNNLVEVTIKGHSVAKHCIKNWIDTLEYLLDTESLSSDGRNIVTNQMTRYSEWYNEFGVTIDDLVKKYPR